MVTKNNQELTKKTIEELLDLLGITDAKVSIEPEDEGVFKIDIDSEHTGVLIGRQGETIVNLQLLLSLIIYKKLGEWQRLVVDVGGWRQQREESLKKLAQNTAQKVKLSGEEVILTRLSPFERRIIHMELSENPDVVTQSQGEGSQRVLVVKLRQANG